MVRRVAKVTIGGTTRVVDLLRNYTPPAPLAQLRLQPPTLTTPTTINVTTTAAQTVDLSAGGDFIINLPSTPLTGTLEIHGRDVARHIVIKGGSIQVPLTTDFTTMLRGGTWALYALRGFTGATGGTFRVQVAAGGAYTASLPYDATPATIKAAVEAVVGTGSVKAVDGPSTPGGPWKFVPADDRLGRPELDLSSLTGTVAAYSPATNYFNVGDFGLRLKQWTGTLHIEGLALGGPGMVEGINVQNQHADAVAQFAYVRSAPELAPMHADWHHPDAFQAYLGPSELRMERCDMLAVAGQGFMGQPRETTAPAALENLHDWWFDRVWSDVRPATLYRTAPTGRDLPFRQEDDWPSNTNNSAGWQWLMSNCYASLTNLDGSNDSTQPELSYFNHYPNPTPSGVTLGTRAPTPFAPLAQIGLNYAAPGYTGTPPAQGALRLTGESQSAPDQKVPATAYFYGPVNGAQLSNGTTLQRTYRMEHNAFVSGGNVRLRYVNEAAVTIYIQAGVEQTLLGTVTPVTFSGAAEVAIPAHTVVESDVVPGLTLTSGSKIATRNTVRVANSGEKWMIGEHNFGGSGKGGAVDGDLHLTGTIPASAEYLFGPVAILAGTLTSTKPKTLAIVMDSLGNTWPTQAFEGVLPTVFVSRNGEAAFTFSTTRRSEVYASIANVATALEGYGTNDRSSGRTGAQIRADRLGIWKELAALGMRVLVTTQAPRTTTTDAGATTTNQTPIAGESDRLATNAWVRDGAPIDPTTLAVAATGTTGALRMGQAGHPAYGYFDFADACESARDSGVWKPNYSTDGIHPTVTAGKVAIAAAFDQSLII